MIKGSIQEDDITILSIYTPNTGSPQYIRQLPTTLKGQINNNSIIVGDFNTPLTAMDRSTRQKINKKTQSLNEAWNQMDLIDIYRTFHPKATAYTFFSSAYGTLVTLRKLKLYQASFPITTLYDWKSTRKKLKNTNTWRLNNVLLNNQWITEEIKEEI